MINGKKILIISPEAWGNNHVSKHHYAKYLSKENEVYFLNPPTGFKRFSFKNLDVQLSIVEENIKTISYKNLIPKLNNSPKYIQEKIYKKMAETIQDEIRVDHFDIVWSFDPYRYFNQRVWKAKKYIYHTVDVHFRKCFEADIAYTSDLVLLSSELLRENLRPFNSNIIYSGHGADIDAFEKSEMINDLPGSNGIKAGLVGNFNNNVDYDLIEKIALHNKGIDFIFIGPYKDNNLGNDTKSVAEKVDHLKMLKNVYFIGSVPSSKIINYLQSLDINMVLYREDKRHIIINPHKMMGYFYSGKITVSTWFNEYSNSSPELMLMAENNNQLPQLIEEIAQNISVHNSSENIEFRREFALRNSYDNKLESIAEFLYNKA
ncbi:MAG: hypothetical protein MK078_02210 [Crocinitomicaceae bacterium]|nr:hypothetical protein [Crocinitomicaceae bacterium]